MQAQTYNVSDDEEAYARTIYHSDNLQTITTKSNFMPILKSTIHKTNNDIIHHSLRNKLHLDLK